ncbi:ABC transporter substrate-binding protein [Spongorhabdus nitratireducens]
MQTAISRTPMILNWHLVPYHAPIVLGRALGLFAEESLQIAMLEPTDPSDVTELVGRGVADIGLKAMTHIYAARQRGYPVKSIGTLLHEPPTGLVFKKSSGIEKLEDIRGKRLGYVGELGKVIIDDLCRSAGIAEEEYECVRVGMNVVDAIIDGRVDTGVGIGCVQCVELEQLTGEPAGILRIDDMAGLGCCCFCSIFYIATETILEQQPEKVEGFMRAIQRASAWMLDHPEQAYDMMCQQVPKMRSKLNQKIFMHCLPFFSRTQENVERDWTKVGDYVSRLGLVEEPVNYEAHYTNEFLSKPPFAAPQVFMQTA